MPHQFTRRGLIKAGGAAMLGSVASPALLTSALAGTVPDITIYGTWEMTAPGIASTAALCDRGSRVAVENVARKLNLNCRYETIDTEGDPGKGVRKIDEQMSKSGAKFFVGGASSSVALAVSKAVNAAGGVYVTTGGADELTGADCAKSTFRWPVATYGAVETTVRPLRQKLPQAKRWYTLTPKYVFGDALLRNTQRVLAGTGAEHVGNAYHTLAEREFSGYLTDALAAKPDVLCLHSFSGQTTDILRQAAEFGLKNKLAVLIVWSAGLDQFKAMGPDLLEGVYLGAQYWHSIAEPANVETVKLFEKTFSSPPSYSEASGYTLARLILEGVAKAGTAEPAKVVAAMEGLRYDGLTGPEEVRAADHQCLKNYYLAIGKSSSKMKDPNDFIEILSGGRAFLDPAKTGCVAI
ncbi:ABC transporter substrate-binding protein [Bradyrhizobium sp.]|uniref:ABC transporter substrate-binding protein n=1 Tax=Bradyrhizobium sp. TaxID=376 RepID=UPI0039E50F8E